MSAFRKKFLIHSSILLGVILIIGASLFFLGEKISVNAKDIETTRKQLYDWIVSLESFASIRAEYTNKAKRYAQVLDNRIPEKESLIDLKKDIQFLGRGEGLETNLTLNNEIDTSSVQIGSIGITFTLRGDMEGILRFLRRLNEIRYIVSIDSMTLSTRADVVEMEAKGKVFYSKQK